jgi:hypothetical protein
VKGVHAEIAHASVLPVEAGTALPVDRLLRIEIARVEKERADFEHPAEAGVPNPTGDLLPTGVEGELRGAADEEVGMCLHRRRDCVVRRQVDSKRLLPQQMLSGLNGGDVDLLVQVVGYRAVHRLDRFVLEHLAVIAGEPRPRIEPLVPGEDVGVGVADDGKLG